VITRENIGERSLALFLMGLLLFNPPILSLFSVDGFLLGIPVLYVYLFVSWSAFIAFMAIRSHGAETIDDLQVQARPPLTASTEGAEDT
jgi:hypothetical protein